MNKHNIINNKKDASKITVALVGNPNCGKTTLFNALTGSNQRVGNWPGVTVERKSGICLADKTVALTDTPGIYSLQPFTPEEKVASEYLSQGEADVIINVVDSTNLERNLLLTTQLIELNIPIVVALNMQDEAQAKGIDIDVKKMQKLFGCPFVWVSAAQKTGIKELVAACRSVRRAGQIKRVRLNADQRYKLIERAVQNAVKQKPSSRKMQLTDKIDEILLNKWLAFPIFALVMTAVFFVSVGGPGGWLTDLINEKLTPYLQFAITNALSGANSPLLASLVSDGIVGGVMSVVSFAPQISLLFGCIAALDACGYMARIAFVTDRALKGLGLSGRSFVCLILGCGCSVPAIMAARTVKSTSERETTVTLAPFVPCSAKLALIAFFSSYAFGGNALVAVSFYFASVIAIILCGLALKLLKKDGDGVFLMELPPYRLPKISNVLRQMWERCKAFLIKAGTVISASSVLLWVLTNFDFALRQATTDNSMLAGIGKAIAPLFVPLGFDDGGCGWQLSVATLSGLAAKETVISALQILLPQGLNNAVSALGAYSFVLFNLFTVPCVAAVSASFSELGSWKKGLKAVLFQIGTAYLLSLTVYRLGKLLLTYPLQCVAAITLTALPLLLVFFKKRVGCGGDCAKCLRRKK